MERKDSKGRRSEFCPSCSRVMMSYVNTMQDFLDKVVEEIEGNTPPSRRDCVPARTSIRDLTDVRKRLPSRRGQTSRAVISLPEISDLKNVTHQESKSDLPKSEYLVKDEQISLDHPREQIRITHSPESKEENVKVLKSESLVQNQFQPSEAYQSSAELTNKQDEYNISSPSIDQKYEVNFQSHIPSGKFQSKSPELSESFPVMCSLNSEISQQTNDIQHLPRSDPLEQHRPQPADTQIHSVENHYICSPVEKNQHALSASESSSVIEILSLEPPSPEVPCVKPPSPEVPCVKPPSPEVPCVKPPSPEVPCVKPPSPEVPCVKPPSPEVPCVKPPSPEVPLPPTWVENMLNICDIPLLLPPTYETEAYVTMATNNLTAIGAVVLGNSLRLSNTSRTLAVLIADEVTDELRNVLASVFHVVQRISSLEPMGSTKLALLEQPELGITYSKLLVWRLTQFDKCLFLSPDTLVIQNCDELFERNEISAVPDIGWPDCFNTAVFVFTPSDETFWNLVNFAETKGSFDGGDQGLLNMYFRSWSLDIHKRLPFIYNLMANVSYTYGPAFVKFGGNAKVVHFFGTTKPWNVQFNVVTGQIAPFSGVHPTFSSYVQYWLTIFARCVLPLFSKDIQEYSTSNNYVNALDLARIVAGSNDAVFSFSPPSFRRYLDSSESVSFPSEKVQNTVLVRVEEKESSLESEEDLPDVEKSEEETKDDSLSDYNRMLAWEQGRMDYLGQDSSDNVLKRLDHAIKKRL